MPSPSDKIRAELGIPRPVFMYHLDQICGMLQINEKSLEEKVLWFLGREVGSQPRDTMRAINIARRDQVPEWRVEEQEFVRWAKFHEFRTYTRYLE